MDASDPWPEEAEFKVDKEVQPWRWTCGSALLGAKDTDQVAARSYTVFQRLCQLSIQR